MAESPERDDAGRSDEFAHWESLGLIQRDEDGRLDLEQAERVRLLRFVAERGVGAEDVARLSKAQGEGVLGHYVEMHGGPRRVVGGLADAAEEVGIDPKVLRRMWTAGGLSNETEVFEEDLEAMRAFKCARRGNAARGARPSRARLGRHVGARGRRRKRALPLLCPRAIPRGQGLTDRELAEATAQAGGPLQDLVDPTVCTSTAKPGPGLLRDDMVVHLVEDLSHSRWRTGRPEAAGGGFVRRSGRVHAAHRGHGGRSGGRGARPLL